MTLSLTTKDSLPSASSPLQKDWSPFVLVEPGRRPPSPRDLSSKEGICDRLRAAAFAEIQARDAFRWAASQFDDAPPSLKTAWLGLALAEEKHLGWLLRRLEELGEAPADRPVSDQLWKTFMTCDSAQDFACLMASAEERGRKAGERFYQSLKTIDAVSAEIFRKIAEEEIEHIELARKFFPDGVREKFSETPRP